MTLLAFTVLAAFALYVMKPEERLRFLRYVLDLLAKAGGAAAQRAGRKQRDPFGEALRQRTPAPLVVPAFAVVYSLVFLAMAMAPGAVSDPETLVAWGGNFGPRTTNVEWGRLLDSTFVHMGLLHLLATIAGLLQAGRIMERLVGHVTFAAVYLTAGFFASVVSLWLHPMDVSVGASGAVFGIYGFLTATAIWGMHRPTGVTIPLQTVRSFAPSVALFVVYNAVAGGLHFQAELAGLAAGFVAGLVLTGNIAERKPEPRRVVAAVATTFAIAAAIAIPMHGITDIRPEIEWIVRLEDGTAARYEAAVERFRKGVISARELAEVIERNIVPELESARNRLTGLGRIPREHRALIARAEEFLRLRDESWRLRAEALEVGNMAILRQADVIETASLETLEAIKPAIRQ